MCKSDHYNALIIHLKFMVPLEWFYIMLIYFDLFIFYQNIWMTDIHSYSKSWYFYDYFFTHVPLVQNTLLFLIVRW